MKIKLVHQGKKSFLMIPISEENMSELKDFFDVELECKEKREKLR